MSSSRIDAGAALPRDEPTAPSEAAQLFDVRRGGWLKQIVPQTMFGRSVLLIVIPLVLVQVIATWVFYARHWETVSRRLANDVAGEIGLVIDLMRIADTDPEMAYLLKDAADQTDMPFAFDKGKQLEPEATPSEDLLEGHLRYAVRTRLAYPFEIGPATATRDLQVDIQLPQGVLSVTVPRSKVYTSTTYIFVMWMIGSSVILLAVSIVFLRNQVKSLRRLAAAADAFGKGRPVPFTKIEGAVEVRQAAAAFIRMRDRIQRQIRQRTEMLAGVSHDLRTPLTRMKLGLELLGADPAVAELKADVVEMERLVNVYLDFARGEGTEAPVETDIGMLLEDVAASARREGAQLSLETPTELVLPLRQHAVRRCVGNLIGNARRYGAHIWVAGVAASDGVDILVDDDGPGIAAIDRDRVFQPFTRLDTSRNPSTGGIGLGLTIARDVARSHGGDVQLETSPHGGLRARIHLPR